MKRRSIVLLTLGAAVVALAAAPFLIPLTAFKGPLENAVSGALGRGRSGRTGSGPDCKSTG